MPHQSTPRTKRKKNNSPLTKPREAKLLRQFLQSYTVAQNQTAPNMSCGNDDTVELEDIEDRLNCLKMKESPSNKELMEFLSLATQRTDIKSKHAFNRFETIVIPKIIQSEIKKKFQQ